MPLNRLWATVADLVVPPRAVALPRPPRPWWLSMWKFTHRGAHTMHLHTLRHPRVPR